MGQIIKVNRVAQVSPVWDFIVMENPEIQKKIDELKEWIGPEYGRQSELAAALDVPRQRVNDWVHGKRFPNLEQWLKIQEFLKKQKRRKKA
jgi:hypothetical protein